MVIGNKKMDKMPDKEMRAKKKERMEKFLEHYHKARNIALLKLGVFTHCYSNSLYLLSQGRRI